jgi:hypothetical protein
MTPGGRAKFFGFANTNSEEVEEAAHSGRSPTITGRQGDLGHRFITASTGSYK